MEKLLKKLISFKTETENPEKIKDALNWIKKQLKELPLFVHDFECEGFPSLILTTKKTKKPLLWLQSHIDVVGGPDAIFNAKIKNRRIYG